MRAVFILCCLLVLTSSLAAQTTVEWWQFWTDPQIKPTIDSMVAEFEAAHPDIEINLTDLTWSNGHEKIAMAFASGAQPDVVELGSDWIAQFAATGQLADLTEHVSTQRVEYQGWSMATYKDRVYAKPWILGTRVIYFNRDLMNRAGFEPDYVPLSLSEFGNAIELINDLSDDIYGWGSNTAEKHRLYKKFMPFFWSVKGQVFTDDGRFCVVSSQQAVRALEFYKELHDCCGYVANQRGIEDAFLEGKVGLILSGDWLLKRIELEGRDINFGTVIIPGPDPQFSTGRMFSMNYQSLAYPGKSFLGGEFLAVSAASPHQDEARAFVDFITAPDNQVRFCVANRSANPSSRTARQAEYFLSNPHLQTFVKQLNLTRHPPVDPDWVHIEAELEAAVERVLFEDSLPGETLRALQHKITELRRE